MTVFSGYGKLEQTFYLHTSEEDKCSSDVSTIIAIIVLLWLISLCSNADLSKPGNHSSLIKGVKRKGVPAMGQSKCKKIINQ